MLNNFPLLSRFSIPSVPFQLPHLSDVLMGLALRGISLAMSMVNYTESKLRGLLTLITKFEKGDPSWCFASDYLCKHTHSGEQHTHQSPDGLNTLLTVERGANECRGEQNLGNKKMRATRMIMYITSLWGERHFYTQNFSTSVFR